MNNHTPKNLDWYSTGKLLVCVGPSPSSARVVRASKQMAEAFGCPWLAVHVELPDESGIDRNRSSDTLRHAETLGGETTTIYGEDTAECIINYAKRNGVTRIVIGKTGKGYFPRFFRATLVDRIIRLSGDIDILVVRGEGDPLPLGKDHKMSIPNPAFNHITGSILVLVVCTLVSLLFRLFGFADANIIMVFLSGVVFTAGRYGRWPGIAVSVISVFIFDVIFVEPYFTVNVQDTQYFIVFAVMLVISLFISNLTARLKRQAEIAGSHERRTDVLYSLSRHLAAVSGTEKLIDIVIDQFSVILDADVTFFSTDSQGNLSAYGSETLDVKNDEEWEAVRWAYENKRPAGKGTDNERGTDGLFIPICGTDRVFGVLGIHFISDYVLTPDRKQMIDSCATQISVAMERESLAEESRKAQLQIDAEKWRNTLLSSVSHDLRTPLAGIAGTASALLSIENGKNKPEHHLLLENISSEANRLSRLVENLLSLVRIESGSAALKKEWLPVEEVIGSSLQAVKQQLGNRLVTTHLPGDMPLIFIDGVLIGQAIINILDNATKYTPQDTGITIGASIDGDDIVIEIRDGGSGITQEEMPRLFDKFFRGGRKPSGSGLGLTIVKAIVDAHNGGISVENVSGGGACFRIKLPVGGQPPILDETDII